MTKRDQAVLVSRATGLNARQARDALDAVAGVIRVGLLEEGKIKLDGVGTFSVQRRSPRTVVNPSTGVSMDLPATAVVKFKPVPELRASVEERHR
jgi:nucleoid DNA-binding protein